MSYAKMIDKAGDQAVSALKQADDAVVSVVSQASDFVGGMLPELGLPFPEQIPTARELVDTGFGLAEKVLKTQRTYLNELFKALEPITGKIVPDALARKPRKAAASTKAA